MPTIRKKELVHRIADSTHTKGVFAKSVIQSFLDEIIAGLAKGNRLEFRDFGVFNVKEQAARTALNPKTMERVQVPAKRKVKLKMGRIMKEKLNSQIPD